MKLAMNCLWKIRNAINNGIVIGPRIFSSGKTISSTGGKPIGIAGNVENLIEAAYNLGCKPYLIIQIRIYTLGTMRQFHGITIVLQV